MREQLGSPGLSSFVQTHRPPKHQRRRLAASARARAPATRWNDHRVARTGRAARSCPASGSATLLRELPRTQFPWGLNMAPRGETPEVCVSAHCPIGTCQSLHLLLSRARLSLPFLKVEGLTFHLSESGLRCSDHPECPHV